ncbi:GDP-mannose 4,6-dehydratase [Nocardioides limicola]|uniref:GDP-mannose 4,6-dehydratase n=1 Tax=Nocardioides limicola TaxID=2803368 RepID=UPI00193B18FF|nr:GDP-mannose 4,6-dehydratase [Nocardioides sp. DJM-14]
MTTAFITGVHGQDGSLLAEQLAAEGAEVHGLAQPGTRSTTTLPASVVLHQHDLSDVATVRALLHDVQPDEVYNLAAVSSVARSWEQPDLVAQVNGAAAVSLMESAWQVQEARGHRVRFVQASSAEIFGEPPSAPQTESTPIRPTNPYGAAKAYAHLMVDVYRRRGLHACAAILYNHESPRRPRDFVTRRITAGVSDIAHGRADRLLLGDLSARRDWGWAADYVQAMVLAARAPHATDYVLASGTSRPVREFVATAFACAGITEWEPLVASDPTLTRPPETRVMAGDATRARELLGWRPTVDFETLVTRMMEAELQR